MITKLLTLAGLRSPCCSARIETWHAGKYYCSKCEAWLDRQNTQIKAEKTKVKRPHAVLKHV